MKQSRLTLLAMVWLIAGCAASVSAQAPTTENGLSPRQLLTRLTNGVGTGTGVSSIGEVIADLTALAVSTAPLGSSAGGFTFTFDPETRTFSRAAPSFGPNLGERAITAGQGRANFGLNFIHSTYDSLDGLNLHDGSLDTAVLKIGSAPAYVGSADLDIKTDTLVLFSNVALNDWFDFGIAVPYVSLKMTGVHTIADEQVSGSATASGLGDVALRAKVRLYRRGPEGVALGVDARLPTGDREALLGTGVTRTLVSGIWSTTRGRLAPHASAGFEYWTNPFQVYDPLQGAAIDAGRHALVYNGGMEWIASDRLTVNGEFTGRSTNNGGRLGYRDLPFRANPFGITSASVASVTASGLSQVAVSGGVKWNFAGSALLTATILKSVTDAGLRDDWTPVVGMDWGF